MAVSRQDSQNWTSPGTKDAMAATYAAVKAALAASDTLKKHDIEIFLQGSYANATNIRGDSDVDIVVMLRSAWSPDLSLLSADAKAAYHNDHQAATYGAKELRRDVMEALTDYFGANRVEARNKCIRVNKRDGLVDADVVPAIQRRLYVAYDGSIKGRFVEGTKIHPLKGDSIINYPKSHKINGETKSSLTNENFKPTVRQFKQLKRRAVASGTVDPKKSPGYLVECMVFNAPHILFVKDDHDRLIGVFRWLLNANFDTFTAVDEIHKLFHTDPGKFSADEAKVLVIALGQEIVG